jgi:4-amino-4-deoxy-L-arabinose transferase-like glycosyltransferase
MWLAVAASFCVGILGRGYWTPDEPREADIAWRMSWQTGKAVPLLAGEAFCEKPPFAYWVAAAAIDALGPAAWVARLPNLLYALLTALAVGWIGRRGAGPMAAVAAAAAISTFLLSYQVTIWLATDAPLLAAVAVALLGLYLGFYAEQSGERLRGYTLMHAALAVGFLSKSAAAWMVPVLTLLALVVWERRWRELLRWELYVGAGLQGALILCWVSFVYAGPDGPARLKVFFWNNLAGRFAHVDAPDALQYAAAHRNTPGKYLLELPVYLWPWTLLVIAAARRAWRQRHTPPGVPRLVRFAVATFAPTLAVLSVAATARNIYLAPALPGVALLLGWWTQELVRTHDRWDVRAARATAALLFFGALMLGAAVVIVGLDGWDTVTARALFATVSAIGVSVAAAFALAAWRAATDGRLPRALLALVLAYTALLVGPTSQIYRRVDAWQDLAAIGRDIRRDAAGRPLILFAPDETTRAFIDMYARTSVELIPGPITENSERVLAVAIASRPQSLVVAQLEGRNESPSWQALAAHFGVAHRQVPTASAAPAWAAAAGLGIVHRYALPNGRRYALLAPPNSNASR